MSSFKARRICRGIYYAVARKGTIWWQNPDLRFHLNVRQDNLLCFKRLYSRIDKVYAWQIIIGRFQVVMFPSLWRRIK